MAHDYLFHPTKNRRLAYWQPVFLADFQPPQPVDDSLPAHGQAAFPDEVYRPRRAASSAYDFRQNIVGVAPANEELPFGALVYPERAILPRRASEQAYFVATGPPYVEELIVELKRGDQDQTPRPYPRAANAAYFVHNGPPDEELPGGETGWIADRFRPYARAASNAYLIAQGVPPPDPNLPIRPLLGEPGFLFVARRAANASYHRDNRFVIADEFVPAGKLLCPERAPGPLRATREAYLAGGGATDLIVQGAPRMGCPFRDLRPQEVSQYASRPDEASQYASRPQEGDYFPGRPDDCR